MYRADTSARYCSRWTERKRAGVLPACLRRACGANTLGRVETTRSVIDYSLARRATWPRSSAGGRRPPTSATRTPTCCGRPSSTASRPTSVPGLPQGPAHPRDLHLRRRAGQYSGRIKATRELAQMEYEVSEFTVYVVEVCQTCGWNHLRESYVLGHGAAPARRRRRTAASRRPAGAALARTRAVGVTARLNRATANSGACPSTRFHSWTRYRRVGRRRT